MSGAGRRYLPLNSKCLRNNTGGIPALRQQETLMLTAKALANTFDAMVPLLGD